LSSGVFVSFAGDRTSKGDSKDILVVVQSQAARLDILVALLCQAAHLDILGVARFLVEVEQLQEVQPSSLVALCVLQADVHLSRTSVRAPPGIRAEEHLDNRSRALKARQDSHGDESVFLGGHVA
jgi:hypothetical protein